LLVREQRPHGLVAAGKAPQNVEDEDVLRDRVVAHGPVTLLERAKLGVEL
jgi:hypothetical protein